MDGCADVVTALKHAAATIQTDHNNVADVWSRATLSTFILILPTRTELRLPQLTLLDPE